MAQNTSSAVMQQRHEAHDSLEDFPTPPWATRALCEWIWREMSPGPLSSALDPAANRGHMTGPLAEYFGEVRGADIHDYGAGFERRDYLFGPPPAPVDWMITNPPFKLAEEFITQALSHANCVAVFVRSAFMEAQGRYKRLFADNPPSMILQFTERVTIWKGVLLDPDVKVWRYCKITGLWKGDYPSSATAYSWVIWAGRCDDTRFRFIGPCRKRLTRPGDYPPLPDHLRKPAAVDDPEWGALI